MSSAFIALQAVHKTYCIGNASYPVLRDLNWSLKPGACAALVGRSGSGKSTLLHLLAGLDKPTQGEVLWQGQKCSTLSASAKGEWRNRHLGFIFQHHHLLDDLTACENVALPLWLRGERRAQQQAEILLKKLDLGHRLHHKPAELSGGESQRVAVARALIGQPSCILADEPTGSLDNASADHVMSMLLTAQRTRAMALVVVTHDVELARNMNECWLLTPAGLELMTNVAPSGV